uniref:zona pellucida-like domain-containing protein 1 n=1 Tax=Monopterus albus TaxID=43700 RepID=UPI0009B42EEC|nr:zona pellucida-like domain-containing protein 1 [Monopterus albus]
MKSFFLLLFLIARSNQLTLTDCGTQARRPQLNDISVQCGTSSISLAIQFCPVLYSGYNESLLILNNNLNPGCNGTLDTSVSPPVVRFTFPINLTNACGSSFKTVSAAGTDLFSDFSNIQTVSVCGMVKSFDPTTGTVTYNTELKYYYSCSYPLEYILNNTEVDVTGQSIAATLNNGSFLSTLSMKLFSDTTYTTPLLMPSTGILMRTNVYVEVKATNLTTQYNVLLDRCYASISALPSNSTYFNLFVPCTNDRMTTMLVNGMNQSARFYFPAFRFLEQQNQSVSTYYLHCITRLCEPNSCAAFKQCSGTRRKRAADGTDDTSVTKPYTISSPAIVTQADTPLSNQNLKNAENNAGTTTKLGVSVGILAVACVIAFIVGAVFYRRFKRAKQ